MRELLGLSVAFVATSLGAWPLLRVLRQRGVLDVPNARSSHARVTPRGGGIAVCVGVGLGLSSASAPAMAWGVYAGAVAAAVVGFADDLRGLSALLRLAAQAMLSLTLGVWLTRDVELAPAVVVLAALAATVWMTAYVNAFNFMDGINGISGVSAAAAGAWFLLLGETESVPALGVGGAVLVGGAVGFLPWNTGVARMFLGDVGSYFFGTMIGALVVAGAVAGVAAPVLAAPLLPYLADTGWTLVGRLRRGESWREAHRDHAYQRLCDVGWSHGQVSCFVLAVTSAVCLAVGLLPAWFAVVVSGLVLAGYLAAPRARVGLAASS